MRWNLPDFFPVIERPLSTILPTCFWSQLRRRLAKVWLPEAPGFGQTARLRVLIKSYLIIIYWIAFCETYNELRTWVLWRRIYIIGDYYYISGMGNDTSFVWLLFPVFWRLPVHALRHQPRIQHLVNEWMRNFFGISGFLSDAFTYIKHQPRVHQ